MKKYVSAMVLLWLLTFLTSSVQACDKPEGIKVGFIGSFSGAAQIYGEAAKNGFEMALETQGDGCVKVVYEDDQFLPAKTVAAFKKLVDVDNVDLVISIGSTPSSAVAPLAQAGKLPLIAWASDKRVSRDRSYVIRSYPSGFTEGDITAREAVKRKYKKIGVVISNNDYAQSWQSGVVASIPAGDLILDEVLTGDIKDFKPVILKARSAGVKAFGICLDPGKNGLFARQVHEIDYKQPFFGCEYLHAEDELISSQGGLKGAWFFTTFVKESFREKYKKKFGNDNVISGAANHYDVANLIHQALDRADNEGLLAGLLNSGQQDGAVGKFKVVDSGEDRFFDLRLVLKEVSG